jgi:hypothetical protein
MAQSTTRCLISVVYVLIELDRAMIALVNSVPLLLFLMIASFLQRVKGLKYFAGAAFVIDITKWIIHSYGFYYHYCVQDHAMNAPIVPT